MNRTVSSGLLCGTSLMALSLAMVASTAYAQNQQAVVEEVVVTGSRLTTGFETPTPVTVMSQEALLAAAPNSVADALQQVPALSTSLLSVTPVTSATGTNGQSLLNLRNLGQNRSLILLDGHRTVATNQQNTVDINTLPSNLMARVDVVTGGASAAYGSDAVAGVVNFVLDTKFVGLKADIGGGISRYGDLGVYKGSLAWGEEFLDGKLHVIASTQYLHRDGVGLKPNGRGWWDHAVGLVPNQDKVVVNGVAPGEIIVPNIRSSRGADGGVITSTGVLKGIQFLAGGQIAPFNYGTQVSAAYMSGGDGSRPNIGFAPNEQRIANFIHAEYDINDDITVYVQGGYNYAYTRNDNEVAAEVGNNQFTIFSGNPYIPASIQTIMTASNIKSFTLGRYLDEVTPIGIELKTRVNNQVIGVKGNNPFGLDGWHYDLSFTNGTTIQFAPETNLPNNHNIYAAADVVVQPGTGKYVCRSQYYDAAGNYVAAGTGKDPGCVPINLFGLNSITPSAWPFIVGDSWKRLVLNQKVFQGTLSGDLGDSIALGAGPISVATGAEYREEDANQISDALSQGTIIADNVRGINSSLVNRVGYWRFYNPLPFHGKYNVWEIFGELGIPILADKEFAKSLNADLAVRHTHYSLAGPVTTWKAGGDYQPIDDVRFRGTVSRDIRAPNLLELFNGSTQASNNQNYPCGSCAGVTPVSTPALNYANLGNPNLKPEKALTITYGVVVTPTFLPGLSLSADYYNIKVDGSIAAPSSATSIDNCYKGLTSFCANFVYTPPSAGSPLGSLVTYAPFFNYTLVKNAGFDFELQYKTELFDNPLTLHLLANHIVTDYNVAPFATPISALGTDTSPHWKGTAQVSYGVGPWNVLFQERYISPSLMSSTKLAPASIDNNNIGAYYISDLTLTYNLEALGNGNQVYLTVNNLFDRAPPTDVGTPTTFSQPTNRSVYDGVGQFFNFGVRFRF